MGLKLVPSIEMLIAPFFNVPNIILSKVDFPQPFLPKTPKISPVSKEKEISLRTSFFPKFIEALCNLKIAK
jgi:hypothetical protein